MSTGQSIDYVHAAQPGKNVSLKHSLGTVVLIFPGINFFNPHSRVMTSKLFAALSAFDDLTAFLFSHGSISPLICFLAISTQASLNISPQMAVCQYTLLNLRPESHYALHAL